MGKSVYEFILMSLGWAFIFISIMKISSQQPSTTDSLRIVTQERDEYKALYLKCNGVISITNEKGKFDSDGKLK